MNILVIDDEELILSLAENILQKENYNVILADSGEKGLEYLSDNGGNIDLVILDLHMPGLSGPETLRRIRLISKDLPCIFSTGDIFDVDIIPDELLVNTFFLEKPYRSKQLTQKVNEILKF
ncbi:MAG: response regulator [candidate division Zixibacteria bacterium]|nr:response regulator [candidate division Zixibacteria bacterium]